VDKKYDNQKKILLLSFQPQFARMLHYFEARPGRKNPPFSDDSVPEERRIVMKHVLLRENFRSKTHVRGFGGT